MSDVSAGAVTTHASASLRHRRVAYTDWPVADLASGEHAGTRATRAGIAFDRPVGRRTYIDPFVAHAAPQEFEYAAWTSRAQTAPFPFTDLIASWQADTPPGSWIEIAVQVGGAAGLSAWFVVARWAGDDSTVHPTSVPGQRDATGRFSTDAWLAAPGRAANRWRLRVTLLRQLGDGPRPVLRHLGTVVSALPEVTRPYQPSRPDGGAGVVLDLPAYSQRLHAGQYAHWDGGGDAWCSPTATTMVLHFWGVGPSAAEYAWVESHYVDRYVHHAVRHSFDYAYGGAGNWSFNTAYAGRYGVHAFVTRLRDLTEAEAFIAAGIPLVASIQVVAGELTGAEYTTSGHLLVIAGFTPTGDVVCHDPAAAKAESVRRVYDRAELEYAWLAASGGIVYVIHPHHVPLPPRGPEPNW